VDGGGFKKRMEILKMNKFKITRDLIFILFLVFNIYNALYAEGSFVSRGSLGMTALISSYFLYKTLILKEKKSLLLKSWTALLFINVVGFVFTAKYTDPLQYSMFMGIVIKSLIFYPFYYLSRKNYIRIRHFQRFFIIMIPIVILQYYFKESQILLVRLSGNTDVVNNVGYSFVALLPFVFLFTKKRVLGMATMMILMFFIIQSGKRGALISGLIGLLLFVYYQLKTMEKENRFRSYLFVLIGILVLSYFAYDIYQNNEFVISRMEKIGEAGGSSGRDLIYTSLFNTWAHSESIINIVFGYGFAASLKFAGGSFAHNDWLELLSNFGLFGVITYMLLFLGAIKFYLNKKWRRDKRILLLAILLMWFFITLVSMWYTSTIMTIHSMLLGFLIGSKSNSLE